MNIWPNVFMKVMRTTMKSYPVLDLKSLIREEVIVLNLPCRNICESVKAGYFEKVPKYENLNHLI